MHALDDHHDVRAVILWVMNQTKRMDDQGEFSAAWEDQTGIKRLAGERRERECGVKRGDMQRCIQFRGRSAW